jgi:hypothetical protein
MDDECTWGTPILLKDLIGFSILLKVCWRIFHDPFWVISWRILQQWMTGLVTPTWETSISPLDNRSESLQSEVMEVWCYPGHHGHHMFRSWAPPTAMGCSQPQGCWVEELQRSMQQLEDCPRWWATYHLGKMNWIRWRIVKLAGHNWGTFFKVFQFLRFSIQGEWFLLTVQLGPPGGTPGRFRSMSSLRLAMPLGPVSNNMLFEPNIAM